MHTRDGERTRETLAACPVTGEARRNRELKDEAQTRPPNRRHVRALWRNLNDESTRSNQGSHCATLATAA